MQVEVFVNQSCIARGGPRPKQDRFCERTVDLEAKLDQWERCYNFHNPHGAFNGKIPYETLRERL